MDHVPGPPFGDERLPYGTLVHFVVYDVENYSGVVGGASDVVAAAAAASVVVVALRRCLLQIAS